MKFKRLLSLGLALSLSLSLAACGGGGDETTGGEGDEGGKKVFIDWNDTAHEMEDFLILHSEQANDGRPLSNCIEGLLTTDADANIIPQIATKWSHNDDASEWYFTLRDDVKWVNHEGEVMADLVAEDFLTGIEWTLNYHKNDAKHLQMLAATIQGAQEYFDYTKEQLDETAGKATKGTDAKFLEMVGIEAPDSTHLVFKLIAPTPYFDSVIMGSCGYPLSQKQVEAMGVDGVLGQTNETMWYNGPYIMDEFIMNNSKIFVKNPHYYNPEIVSFDEVQVKMVPDTETDDTMFMTGEIDRCTVSESNLRLIYNDASHPFHDNLVEVRDSPFAYQIHFNYNKLKEDGTPDTDWNKAVNNEAFRQAVRYGVNLEAYWARFNFINPESGALETFTAAEVAKFSDGRDYTDRVKELLNLQTGSRYDAAKGADYVAQAKAELAAEGVNFPIELRYYIKAGDQVAGDNANVLKQAFEDCFGKDMINFVIDEYVTSFSQEVQASHLHSIQTSGWGADYRDPENFLTQIITGSDSAYYAARMDFENEALPEAKAQWDEFTRMVLEANKITGDLDERYEAQAQAEAYCLDHALIVPLRCPFTAWAMTRENCFTHPRNSFKYVNYELKDEPYTTAEYEQLWADFNAGK